MRKMILYTFFLLPTFILSLGRHIEDAKTWRDNFKKIDHSALKKVLGYDPGLELIEDNNPEVLQQGGPTLYVHGWLSSKNATAVRSRCNDSNKIPGDIIIFNLPDATEWINESIPYYMPFNKSNFAQEKEVKVLLCIIKALHDAGIDMPVYYPHSRGGAIIKKVIGILNQPSQEWLVKLKNLGINKQDRHAILNALKIVYFNTPLKNIHLTIKKHCEDNLALITYYFPVLKPFVAETVTHFMKERIFPLLTSFDPKDTREPIDYLNDWKNLDITTVLHFQHPDNFVPSEDNIDCAKILLTINANKTYVIIGNDGDHGFGDVTLAKIIHTLNKKFNCSYLKKAELLAAGQILLDENKPTLDTVEDHILKANERLTQDNLNKPLTIQSKISIYTVAAALGLIYYLTKGNKIRIIPART